MMGCLASSTATGDAVGLFERAVEGLVAGFPVDALGMKEMGGLVLVSMGILFVIMMLCVA